MEKFEESNERINEEVSGTPAILKKLSELVAAQNKDMDMKLSELSHINEAETGFNPTVAELEAVHEGIKAQIKALGEPA
jgi:hypothetical protein